MAGNTIEINRAPVLTLWAAVVAERQGYDPPAALTLGKAVAGLNAQRKGRSLGIYGPTKADRESDGRPARSGQGEDDWVQVCGRSVPVKHTPEGLRAVVKDKPLDPAAAQKYLESKFGRRLAEAKAAMAELAGAYKPDELEAAAYGLYEAFRPQIARGRAGWGQKAALDLDLIRSLAARE